RPRGGRTDQDRGQPALRAEGRGAGPPGPGVPQDHRLLDLRDLRGAAMRVEKLTASIGAELFGVDLGEASRNGDLFGAIKEQLLKHRVLFRRDQDSPRAEQGAFAEKCGPREDHRGAGNDREHPGLVRIYKDLDSPPEHYETAWHCDAPWRAAPPMGCVLRQV